MVNSFDHSDVQCSELCTNHSFCLEEFVVDSGQAQHLLRTGTKQPVHLFLIE